MAKENKKSDEKIKDAQNETKEKSLTKEEDANKVTRAALGIDDKDNSGKKKTGAQKDDKKSKAADEKGKASPKKKSGGKASKSKKDKVVVFDAGAISFYLVALVAVLALTALAINIISPSTFDKVFYSNPIDRGGMVMQIGDYKVMADEYTNIIMSEKANSGQTEAEYWRKNPSDDKKMIQYVEEYLIMKYTYVEWAKDLGIVVDDEIRAKVDQATQEAVDKDFGGDYEAFLQSLDENFYTKDLYFRMAYQEEMLQQFFDALRTSDMGTITQEDYAAYGAEHGLMSAKHILIQIDQNATEAEIAEKEALAKDIKRRLDAGEDFDTLMNEYSEDGGLEQFPNGYNFETGAFMQEFADACAELEVGEYSDLVESSYGYHIIMRIETDYSVNVLRSGNQEVSYEDEILSARLAEELVKKQETISITYGRGYKYITVAEVNYEFAYPKNSGNDLTALPADPETDNEEADNTDGGNGTE